jgi:hypothetical protein
MAIRRWNELSEEVKAPPAVLIALATARPEMLKIVPKEPATAEETAQLYNVIRVLLETNRQLQEHAQELATRAKQVRLSVRGIQRKMNELESTANYESSVEK